MKEIYQHLGIYSDLVAEAQRQQPLYPLAKPGIETQHRIREILGFNNNAEIPQAVRTECRWEKDGVEGEEVSWWVGYGPRTHAYLLKPLGAQGALPGVVALHDHGGFKFYGKEKIAEGPDETLPVQDTWWKSAYGGRAFANALARHGFTVLVPDVFLWGSRKFPIETMPEHMREGARLQLAASPPPEGFPYEIAEYNTASSDHEHLVSKYCNLLGTDMAGVVSHEDRIAVNYLLSRPDVLPGGVGCVGLSGGGNRGALLQATHSQIRAAVIVGLMSTYAGLLDHNVASHTWMFFPLGWARCGDWSDLAACRAPSPLLVQYDLEDPLFTLEGMRAAHERIASHYSSTGHPEEYTGQFYPGEHKFDLEMQEAAFKWLNNMMKG